ncbi:sensor histidine kinase [Paenibacillus sp. CAA11]|uniref:sensor histidine kinase n=1 Tax=Paenibacillus sp. CAA11 TaxID=1532905 RepID=UPI000D3C4479|nr:sensor histidine kinase [Paenibacillus sp. CAA11]AWB43530.1 sensor histidine kinase [Paenibacillus sp. CAA11]
MKLFLREHLALTLWTLAELLVVVLVFWYDGYDHWLTALYAVLLGLFFYAGYLTFRYTTHRIFYYRLSRRMESMKEFVPSPENAPLSRALDDLMDAQYGHYHALLQSYELKQKEHLTFMNQWVHQMKTPLSVIEMTAHDEDEDDPRFRSITEEADQIRRGLEMVLYAARLDAFEQDFSVEPVLLRDVAGEAVHELKRFFIRNHVYPEILIEPDLSVQSDAKWLRFVLLQVLSNAIKYSSGSGEKVTIRACALDKSIILEVLDRGAGIPKADLQRVFRPFYTGENGRFFKESTGMGLYLAKEVLTKLGHRIELESAVGEGTLVRIICSREHDIVVR